MPLGIKHPFGGHLYEQDGEGNIRVTLADGSKSGIFGLDGQYISGELRECDPQLCGWVGGPIMANHRLEESKRNAE